MFSKPPRWLLCAVKFEEHFPKGSHPVYWQIIYMLMVNLRVLWVPLLCNPDFYWASAMRWLRCNSNLKYSSWTFHPSPYDSTTAFFILANRKPIFPDSQNQDLRCPQLPSSSHTFAAPAAHPRLQSVFGVWPLLTASLPPCWAALPSPACCGPASLLPPSAPNFVFQRGCLGWSLQS